MINLSKPRHDFEQRGGGYRHPLIGLALAGAILAGGYFLSAGFEFQLVALVSYLPYLLFLLCPLMHVFMHHGRGSDKKRVE
ncbi:MAG: DUF2933 domain-containing protein [Candidatus Magasanikbacteria bacterium]|jgi:hypothetical protein|nr:DUF2933 domain-containing protein [Candidatus Magasanikbacteria bacterium]